ncbi:hypothetical protein BKA64DRAFT_645840 [Cadophora sp. MPI-SDFR-AT-0126]|nr:hypothetical protein BKA64DRAFT_645840 [Leotiomycetes sp. MPI-SDFR-AT-0126]
MSEHSVAIQAGRHQNELWATLKKAVENHQSSASYCCGGSIAIDTSPASSSLTTAGQVPPGTAIKSPPIALRWDVKEAGHAHAIHFPQASLVSKNTRSSSTSSQPSLLEQLLVSCAPATFGRKNKDILDESYRKAGTLDRSQFSVDFHPYDYGIVDTISQILLPQVYSAPSDLYIDVLWVTNTDATTIRWAAFYSDCEHEVLEVTSGHRVTLTYNLYVTESVGKILHPHPSADLESFPLYQGVKQLNDAPNVFKAGQKLGFYCQHQYAHTRDGIEELMPFTLKGIDAIPHLRRPSWDCDDRGYIGEKLYALVEDRYGGWQDLTPTEERMHLHKVWPSRKARQITWLNGPTEGGWEIACVGLTYGSEASLNLEYSHAVILIDVPEAAKTVSK